MYKVAMREPPERCFGDFAEGQEMPVVTKGPMTAGHQVRWAGASDNYASEFHHDAAVAREQGLPGLLLSGPLMAALMYTEVTHWLGARARVVACSNRNTAPTMPGDLARIHARIKRRWAEGDRGFVEVDCRIEDGDGRITTPGSVIAELPLDGAGRGGTRDER